jgi:polar amino acid transport system substrate-binding protein
MGLGASPSTLEGDNFTLSLQYEDGSVASVVYLGSGGPRMPKERVEILGGGRSTVLDDFRHADVYAGRRRERGRRLAGQDKGHGAALAAAMKFFAEGGEPPIPYARLFETTRATFVARDALVAGDGNPRAVHG